MRRRIITKACISGLSIGLIGGLLGCGQPEGVHGWAQETRRSAVEGGATKTTGWSNRTIEALTQEGSDYRHLSTQVDTQGEFFIADVPAGPFWLSMPDELTGDPDEGRMFAWTDARELDLNFTRIGTVDAMGSFAAVPITFTGLAAVETGDYMFTSSTGNTWTSSWGLTPPGGTSAQFPPGIKVRLRSEPGEQLIVKQWRQTIRDGLIFETALRAARAPVPDATTMLTIPLTEAPQQALNLQVDSAAFMSELAPLWPATGGRWNLNIFATGFPKEPLAPSEQLFTVSPRTAGRDANFSGLAYHDTAPASYTRRYQLTFMGGRNYPVPNETVVQANCGTGFRLVGEVGTLAQGMVRPRISLPQGLVVDGQDAQTEGLRLSKTPTVRWRAPRIGQPAFYMLHVIRIATLPNRGTSTNTAARFVTTDAEVKIPEGVLLPGAQYFFEVIAFAGSDIDPKTAPRRASLQEGDVDTAHLCSTPLQINP